MARYGLMYLIPAVKQLTLRTAKNRFYPAGVAGTWGGGEVADRQVRGRVPVGTPDNR